MSCIFTRNYSFKKWDCSIAIACFDISECITAQNQLSEIDYSEQCTSHYLSQVIVDDLSLNVNRISHTHGLGPKAAYRSFFKTVWCFKYWMSSKWSFLQALLMCGTVHAIVKKCCSWSEMRVAVKIKILPKCRADVVLTNRMSNQWS